MSHRAIERLGPVDQVPGRCGFSRVRTDGLVGSAQLHFAAFRPGHGMSGYLKMLTVPVIVRFGVPAIGVADTAPDPVAGTTLPSVLIS